MSDVRELRIGNNLYRDGIIVTIDGTSIRDCEAGWVKYEGIPLTEQILLRCGIKLKSKDEYAYLNYYEVKYEISDWVFETEISIDNEGLVQVRLGEISDWVAICRVKYLHQLQNLIHSLSGKELELK